MDDSDKIGVLASDGLINTMQGNAAVGKRDQKQGRPSGADDRAPMPVNAVDAVGRKLKASYDQMLREPIPDKLMELLDQLEQSESDRDDAEQDDAVNDNVATGRSSTGEE